MELIKSWGDLKKYGISFLTGESCAYGLRGLFDLNEEGKALIEGYFGGTVTVRPGSNWNSEVNGKPAVGSVLLDFHLLTPLAVYILFHVENVYAVCYPEGGGVYGVDKENFETAKDLFLGKIRVNPNYQRQGTLDGRNVHQFTQRVC